MQATGSAIDHTPPGGSDKNREQKKENNKYTT